MDNYIAEIISAIFLTILLIVKVYKDYIVHKLLDPIRNLFTKTPSKLDETAVTSGRMVHNLLIELRVKMNADRASIFLFHNGQYFNPSILNNSIWKFTCAYESCKAGVAYESSSMQNLLVTNYLSMIESLWGEMSEGFERFPCQNCQMDCDKTKNIIVISDFSTLPYGNIKSLLETQGTKKMILSPIVIKNDYVGFIAVSYLSNFTFGGQVIDSPVPFGQGGIKTICEYSNTVGYHLSNYK
jgi:hypothetical protein